MPPTSSTWPRHVDNYPRYMDTLASVCAYRHRSMYACVMYMSLCRPKHGPGFSPGFCFSIGKQGLTEMLSQHFINSRGSAVKPNLSRFPVDRGSSINICAFPTLHWPPGVKAEWSLGEKLESPSLPQFISDSVLYSTTTNIFLSSCSV